MAILGQVTKLYTWLSFLLMPKPGLAGLLKVVLNFNLVQFSFSQALTSVIIRICSKLNFQETQFWRAIKFCKNVNFRKYLQKSLLCTQYSSSTGRD